MKKWFLLILPLITSSLYPQQEPRNTYWTRYFQEASINNLQLDTEIDNRRTFSPHSQQQFNIRTTALYRFNSLLKAGMGFLYAREVYESGSFYIPELRPHQQLELAHSVEKLDFSHRLRTEQRFIKNLSNGELTNLYEFIFRTRYRLLLEYAIIKEKEEKGYFGLQYRMEPFFSYDDTFHLSEYRFYGGFLYQPFETLGFELGYMWLHTIEPKQLDERWNVVRLTIRHYL